MDEEEGNGITQQELANKLEYRAKLVNGIINKIESFHMAGDKALLLLERVTEIPLDAWLKYEASIAQILGA